MTPAVVAPFVRELSATARARPDRVVVATDRRALTAEELVALAGGVAARLVEREPDRTGPVPVLVDRSVEAVIGFFGVQMAGRAAVAVEAGDPVERIEEITARVGATSVLVTGRHAPARIGPASALAVGAVAPTSFEPRPLRPDGLTSVVFTSGSTGRPKGVRLDAPTAEANLDRARLRRSQVGDARTPAFAPFSFVAGLTTLADVAMGASMVLVDLAATDPVGLLDWIDREGFPAVALVPSYVRAAAAVWPADRRIESVRSVNTYGEALQWSDVPVVWRLMPNASLLVSYGASEAGGGITNHEIAPGDPLGSGPIPLGQPQSGREVSLEPVAGSDGRPDEPQEIVVRGVLAAGYWDDPELDARFSVEPDGRRVWRSGDLGAWVEGRLVHRGRVDDLVKVGGRLVEPAEAERALRETDGVVQAVVMAQPVGGRDRLVAHLEVEHGTTARSVRAELSRRLPAHLVPAVVVRHEELPRTARGKADRQVLAGLPLRPWRDEAWEEPLGAEEWLVAGAARSLLDLPDEESVGRDDDLFTLGLDSLAAVELLVVLGERGLPDLSIEDLVEAPTVRALAERARRRRDRSRVAFGPVVLNPDGTLPPVWAVPGAGGTALGFASLAAELGPDRPVVVLEAPGLHDARRPPHSVAAAADAHLRDLVFLRSTRFAATRRAPVVLVGHSAGGLVAHEMAVGLARHDLDARVVLLDTAVATLPRAQRARRFAADLLRSRPGGRATVPALDLPDAWWEALDELRSRRSVTDAARRVPFARPLVGPDGRRRPVDAAHYQRYFLDGLRQAWAYRPALTRAPDLLVLARDSTAADRWTGPIAPRRVATVDATHNAMLHPPAVAEVAEAIRPLLPGSAPVGSVAP